MTVYAITDTKKGRTGIAPTYLQTTQKKTTVLYSTVLKHVQMTVEAYRIGIQASLTCFNYSPFAFCRAMLCKRGLCRHAMSVCLSVTFVHSVKTNKHIFNFFLHRIGKPF